MRWGAVSVRPEMERHLVDYAQGHTVRQLEAECRRVKACTEDAGSEHERRRRSHSFRSWPGRDGAVCFNGRLTPEIGAALKTYMGWQLGGSPGAWTWSPPEDYRDPEPPDPTVGTMVVVNPWTGRAGPGADSDPERRELLLVAPSGTVPSPGASPECSTGDGPDHSDR